MAARGNPGNPWTAIRDDKTEKIKMTLYYAVNRLTLGGLLYRHSMKY